MAGISSELLFRLRQALALYSNAEFSSDQMLRAVFVDRKINIYQNSIPEANSPAQRIDLLIYYLVDHSQDSKNGLVQFLEILADRYKGDDSAGVLVVLARELKSDLRKTTLLQNDSSKKPKLSVLPAIEKLPLSQVSDSKETLVPRKPSIIINTVGISTLTNIDHHKSNSPESELNRKIKEIKAELDSDLLKREDWGQATIARLTDWLEELKAYHNDPDFRLIPTEISALNAIKVTEEDTLYFLADVSDAVKADKGEVCGKALVEYYKRQLSKARVEFIPVYDSIIRNKKLVSEWEILHELDVTVSRQKQLRPDVPIIMNLTGGHRLLASSAARVTLAHGYDEIYYIAEEMCKPVGLPAIDEKLLNPFC
jgi:hypothetical protein